MWLSWSLYSLVMYEYQLLTFFHMNIILWSLSIIMELIPYMSKNGPKYGADDQGTGKIVTSLNDMI